MNQKVRKFILNYWLYIIIVISAVVGYAIAEIGANL